MDKKLLSQAAEYITEADSIIIAAGAGMSVDSGLPDFRGNEVDAPKDDWQSGKYQLSYAILDRK